MGYLTGSCEKFNETSMELFIYLFDIFASFTSKPKSDEVSGMS